MDLPAPTPRAPHGAVVRAEPPRDGVWDVWHLDAGRPLVVERSRVVPLHSHATWGLATHALGTALRREGRADDPAAWRTVEEGAEQAELRAAPDDEGVRLTLRLERQTLGAQVWAAPLLFWPFGVFLAVLVGRGELPWAFWVVPAAFAFGPALALAVRWAGHRVWRALARRRVRRALSTVADAVADGNRMEAPRRATPAARRPQPAPRPAPVATLDDDAWDDAIWTPPFVAPQVDASGAQPHWLSADEADRLGAALPIRLHRRPVASRPLGDGAPGPPPSAPAMPRAELRGSPAPRGAADERARRRTPAPSPAGWQARALVSGFGEWLPPRAPAPPRR